MHIAVRTDQTELVETEGESILDEESDDPSLQADSEAMYDLLYGDQPEDGVEEAGIFPKGRKSRNAKFDEDVKAFVERFDEVAQAEQEKYGIPASITLAQGIVESRAGKSKMALRSLNFYGMKCFVKHRHVKCKRYDDDAKDEPFKTYPNAWASIRDHSLLLATTKRYAKLFKSKDAGAWADGLQKAGYATDRKYAVKLKKVINKYNLTKYD